MSPYPFRPFVSILTASLVGACLLPMVAGHAGARDADDALSPALRAAADACSRRQGATPEARIAACTEVMNGTGVPAVLLAATKLNRGEAYMTTGDETHAVADYEESLRLYDGIVDPRQPVPEVVFQRGKALSALGQADRALADYDKSLELDPHNPNARVERGILLSRRRGEYGRAIADFDSALEVSPNNVEALVNRGDAFSRMGESTRAFADLDRAARIDPDNPRTFVIRGLARGRGGDAQGALADFNLALKDNYRDVDALVNRAAIYSMNSDQRRAIADLDLALSISPRNSLAFYNRGYAHFALKDYGKAIDDYGSAIRVDPNMAIAYNNRCMTRVIANIDLPEAVKDCDAALKARPNRADFRDTRGFVFLKLGKPELAFLEYDTAIKLDARRPLSLYGRAIASGRMGDSEAARTDRAAAIALDPTIEEQFGMYGVD